MMKKSRMLVGLALGVAVGIALHSIKKQWRDNERVESSLQAYKALEAKNIYCATEFARKILIRLDSNPTASRVSAIPVDDPDYDRIDFSFDLLKKSQICEVNEHYRTAQLDTLKNVSLDGFDVVVYKKDYHENVGQYGYCLSLGEYTVLVAASSEDAFERKIQSLPDIHRIMKCMGAM